MTSGTARGVDRFDPVATLVARLTAGRHDPACVLCVALDGRSGAGKSTLAQAVATLVDATVIEGDDFYAGGSPAYWDAMTAAQKVQHVIDWRRERVLLESLRRGEGGRWYPYNWEANDGSLCSVPLTCPPASIVILEGAYSARPELADQFDLRVLLQTEPEIRRARLLLREGDQYRADWEGRWTVAEEHYFGTVMAPEAFDLVLTSA